MQGFYMYLCDGCGFSKAQADICPNCQSPLTMYSKEDQREYQMNMEEAMRAMSEYKWYV